MSGLGPTRTAKLHPSAFNENDMTYMKPRPKISDKIYFCLLGSCNELITGNGIVKMAKSDTRLKPAMPYQTVSESRHLPLIEWSQKAATGTQTKVRRKHSVIVHTERRTTPNAVIRCITTQANILLYWSRIDILTRHMATL